MAKRRTKRPERLELRLSQNEKALILAAAEACRLTSNEFVIRATLKELKRLKIKLKRPQVDLFAPGPGKQTELF